jgi:hypothetical protein
MADTAVPRRPRRTAKLRAFRALIEGKEYARIADFFHDPELSSRGFLIVELLRIKDPVSLARALDAIVAHARMDVDAHIELLEEAFLAGTTAAFLAGSAAAFAAVVAALEPMRARTQLQNNDEKFFDGKKRDLDGFNVQLYDELYHFMTTEEQLPHDVAAIMLGQFGYSYDSILAIREILPIASTDRGCLISRFVAYSDRAAKVEILNNSGYFGHKTEWANSCNRLAYVAAVLADDVEFVARRFGDIFQKTREMVPLDEKDPRVDDAYTLIRTAHKSRRLGVMRAVLRNKNFVDKVGKQNILEFAVNIPSKLLSEDFLDVILTHIDDEAISNKTFDEMMNYAVESNDGKLVQIALERRKFSPAVLKTLVTSAFAKGAYGALAAFSAKNLVSNTRWFGELRKAVRNVNEYAVEDILAAHSFSAQGISDIIKKIDIDLKNLDDKDAENRDEDDQFEKNALSDIREMLVASMAASDA